jgi:hypothetical protein
MSLKLRIGRAAVLMLFVLAASPSIVTADTITFAVGDYDNTFNSVNATGTVVTNNQTTGKFRDVFWWSMRNAAGAVIANPSSPDYINSGSNLILCGAHACPTGSFTALNFTGDSPSGGQSYLTIYDTTPADGTATRNLFSATGGLTISADVMMPGDSHASCGGVVVAYRGNQDGLALLACDRIGNNADSAKFSLIFQAGGQGIQLSSTDLGVAGLAAGAWYNVSLTLTANGDNWTAVGTLRPHTTPADPTTPLGAVINTVNAAGTFSDPDASTRVLTNPGEVGIIATIGESLSDGGCPPSKFPNETGCNDNVGVTVTNFSIPASVPEPGTLLLLGTGLLGLAIAARRRL